MRLIIDGDLRLREAEPFILLARARADKGLFLVLIVNVIEILKFLSLLLLLVDQLLLLVLVNNV